MHARSDIPWLTLGGASAGEGLTTMARGGREAVPVVVKDSASLLIDAAEEVGLHLSEKIERHTHDQRRVTAGRASRRLKIDEITEYLDKSRRSTDPKLQALQIQALLEQAQRPGDRLDIGNAWPETPTERYLLLQLALQKADADKVPASVIERLEQAVADLQATADLQVQADLATIDQAARFGDTAQGIASFQACVHTVLGKPTLVQAFKEALALAEADGSRLDRAIDHLVDALGTCLYALGTTREKVLLRALVTDLYHLKCLNTLFEETQSVVCNIRRMRQQNPTTQGSGHAAAA